MPATSSLTRDRSAHRPLKPFTVDHWRQYARLMVLDNGDPWDPEDFQLQIVEDVFSGVDEVWILVPEGNAKTTLMSGVALYHGDYTPTAEVLLAAASRDQAGLLFNQAAGFVERSPGFADRPGRAGRFKVFEGYRRIKCRRSAGRLQVFAADDRTGDGVIPTLGVIDEGHRHRDMRLVRTWRGKLAKRGGQLLTISTAGEPGTEFEDARERALSDATDVTRNGFHTRAAGPDSVIHDWSVPRDADVEDMKTVKAANPLWSITLEALAKKRRSPSMTENHWRRFVCNQAVRGEDTAINAAEWAACGSGERPPEGEPVWVGADFGWANDTTALVPLWMPDLERRVFGEPQILVPPDDSFLSPKRVKQAFRAINDRNPIRKVVLDPDRAAEITEWLEDDLGAEVVVHSQTHQPMALAYERFIEAIRNRHLFHGRDQQFTEHVLNAVAKMNTDGSARFDRPNASRAQAGQRRRVIDALIAAAMVHSTLVAEFTAEPVTPFVEAIYG